jgi:hypothetical protein
MGSNFFAYKKKNTKKGEGRRERREKKKQFYIQMSIKMIAP